MRGARAVHPGLHSLPENRRGLRQPMFLLRHPDDPRALPQPPHGGCGAGGPPARGERREGADPRRAGYEPLRRRSLRKARPARTFGQAVRNRGPALDPAFVLLPGLHHRRASGNGCAAGKGRQIHRPSAAACVGAGIEGHEPPWRPRKHLGADPQDAGEDPGPDASHDADHRLSGGNRTGF